MNPVGPRGVYDEAKRFAEAMTMAYHRYHGVETRIVRIFNTYGPRMRLEDGRVLPAFMGQALRGEELTVFGDGSQTRSFCYVDDLVEGIWRLLNSDENDAGQHRQPGRDDHPRVRRDGDRDHRLEVEIAFQAAARRRSEGAPARTSRSAASPRLGAEGALARAWRRRWSTSKRARKAERADVGGDHRERSPCVESSARSARGLRRSRA